MPFGPGQWNPWAVDPLALLHPNVLFASSGVVLALGIYVLARQADENEGFSVFLLTLSVAAWLVALGFAEGSSSAAIATVWARAAYVSLVVVGAAAYRFSTEHLGLAGRRRLAVVLMWSLAVVLALATAGAGWPVVELTGSSQLWTHRLHWTAAPILGCAGLGFGLALLEHAREIRRMRVQLRRRRALVTVAGLAVTAAGIAYIVAYQRFPGPFLGPIPMLVGLSLLLAGIRITHAVDLARPTVASILMRNMTEPVLLCLPDGRITGANRAATELLRENEHEVAGRMLHHLFAGDWSHANQLMREITDGVGEVELDLRWSDGTEIPVAVTLRRLTTGPAPDGAALVFLRDRRHEQRIEASLQRYEEGFTKLFRTTPLAIFICTLDEATILEANDQFLALSGYGRRELMGRAAVELGLWIEPEQWDKLLAKLGRTGQVQAFDLRLRSKTGRRYHTEVFAERIFFEGQPCVLALAHDVTSRKAAEQELTRRALYDGLTGLPNRTLFRDRLQHALDRSERDHRGLAVLFIDLNRFKIVNDTLGHAAGDELLCDVARRIYQCFRNVDTLARFGGDEFAVLLEEVASRDEVETAAQRLQRALDPPFTVQGTSVHVSASIGIAIGPRPGATADDLIRYSDVAMYRAKRRSDGTRYHIFSSEEDREEKRRLFRENELRKALDTGGLALAYQPILALGERQVVGAEALLRWDHPQQGRLEPDAFIPLAEETGLIVSVGDWVMRKAVRQLAEWRQVQADFSMSVNLSARQFQAPNLVESIHRVLTEEGVPPDAVQLEITETVAMQDPPRLNELRDLGLRLAIDDFGTGYSSLEYLRRLTVDGIKIDRVFVDDLGRYDRGEAIVQAVLLMANRFGLHVTAEGIEAPEQALHLEEAGCQLGQGFYFWKPLDSQEFGRILQQNRIVTK